MEEEDINCLAAALAILTKKDIIDLDEVTKATLEKGMEGMFNYLSDVYEKLYGVSLKGDE